MDVNNACSENICLACILCVFNVVRYYSNNIRNLLKAYHGFIALFSASLNKRCISRKVLLRSHGLYAISVNLAMFIYVGFPRHVRDLYTTLQFITRLLRFLSNENESSQVFLRVRLNSLCGLLKQFHAGAQVVLDGSCE